MNTFVSFDIDGTLVALEHCCKGGTSVLYRAFSELFGPVIHKSNDKMGSCFLDLANINEMMEFYGFPANKENHKKLQDRVEEMSFHKMNSYKHPCPGVEKLLQTLVATPNVTIGVSTANYSGLAWKKIQASNLMKYFPDRIGGFGLFYDKKEALIDALKMAEDVKKTKFGRKIHIGDTYGDVEAALAAGFIPIVVKTGTEIKERIPKDIAVFQDLEVGYDSVMKIISMS